MNKELFLQTQITDEELNAEVERRKLLRQKERQENRKSRISCENCLYAASGYATPGARGKTKICKKRKKTEVNMRATGDPLPTYYSCSDQYTNKCEFFKHKQQWRQQQ